MSKYIRVEAHVVYRKIHPTLAWHFPFPVTVKNVSLQKKTIIIAYRMNDTNKTNKDMFIFFHFIVLQIDLKIK